MKTNDNLKHLAGEIAFLFLIIKNQLKIYHWQTTKYSRHKASDFLLKKLNKKIDEFIETMQGNWNVRIKLSNDTSIPLLNLSDNEMDEILIMFSNWLQYDISSLLKTEDSDLLSIRDEMLSAVNKTLYLFTFK